MFFKAKDMLSKAKNKKNGNHPTRKADEEYRKIVGFIGIGEKEIMLYDRIVLERHDSLASKAEIWKGQPQL